MRTAISSEIPGGETLIQCVPPAEGFSLIPTDCDDGDATRSPVGPETCNGRDDDCDGVASFVISTGDTEDDDRDGFADNACGGPDCNDLDPYAYPGAPELNDDVDNDCDGTVDEDVTAIEWYTDEDGDGAGGGDPIMSDERQTDRVPDGSDCDDEDAGANEDAVERCDGVDNDCDGSVDESAIGQLIAYLDSDSDGYGDAETSQVACRGELPTGYADNPGDCNDDDGMINPGAMEVVNAGIDDDCDGAIDEVVMGDACYVDGDADGYGTGDAISPCPGTTGYASLAGDCDDGDGMIRPGAMETCDEVDNDCDSMTDETVSQTWYPNTDGDAYGDENAPMQACSQPGAMWTMAGGDCDDGNASIHPDGTEICDEDDDEDCDGNVDEMVSTTYYADTDGDTYGDPMSSVQACSQPADYVTNTDDCDDTEATAYTGATDICDGINNDCDGSFEEDAPTSTWYLDMDGDGYAPMGADSLVRCSQPTDYVDQLGDCNDDDINVFPGATEVCNGISDDCDTPIDETANALCNPIISADLTGICLPPPAAAGECACVDSNLGDCNGDPSDGCETSVALSSQHCGGCDAACSVGEGCNDGTCAPAAIRRLERGAFHTCVVRDFGVTQCWGNNTVLFASSGNRSMAEELDHGLYTVDYASFGQSNGTTHCAITEDTAGDRDVYCWGYNNSGQLGNGTTSLNTAEGTPQRIVAAVDDVVDDWDELAVGAGFVLARRATGEVYSWGNNDRGQIGRVTTGMTEVPTPATTGITNATAVFGANYYGCALVSGELLCFGGDSFGRSGDGAGGSGPQHEAVVDSGGNAITNVTGAALMNDGGCLMRGNGEVWGWGIAHGATNTLHAVQVPNISNATAIGSGRSHCCAVVAGGIIRCYGNNASGKLGNQSSTTVPRNAPVSVLTGAGTPLLGATRVMGGDEATCASLGDFQVTCWGRTRYGQLGNGIVTDSNLRDAGDPRLVMGI